MRRWLGVLGAMALLAACPELEQAPAPQATCVKQYERCKTPAGPLGVCDSTACKPGQAEPCLKCMPQH